MFIELERLPNWVQEFSYPAGELQIRLKDVPLRTGHTITIQAKSLHNGNDIFRLALLCDALKHMGFFPIDLSLPYLPYGRADRPFVNGDCFGLLAFAGLVNAICFSSVRTLDVHSDVAALVIERFTNIPPTTYIQQAIAQFSEKTGCETITLLFPDEGARRRYAKILPPEGVGVQIAHATKKRDSATGEFLGFSLPEAMPIFDDAILIIDDICDGGGTFMGLGSVLRTRYPKAVLGLYVTHGIFSKPITTLGHLFRWIFTTDTFEHERLPEWVTEFKISETLA